MNGVHDMGGMQNFGAIPREENEPVFHEPWEGRIWALRQALKAWGKWNADASRYAMSMITPAEYLGMSYYERQATGLVELLVASGLATRAEIEDGKPAPDSPQAIPPLTADQVPTVIAKGHPASRDVNVPARFQVGEQVRARNIHPVGHTRLPRYARGKLGAVDRDHGVFVFPDSNAHFLGEKPQHVYAVRFEARELWGEQAGTGPRDAVYIDLWDDYLERV
jgi:nitrile hydratase beta subunit